MESDQYRDSRLARYVRDELFDSFVQNRRVLEEKWARNLMIWKGDVTDFWKNHQADDEGWKSQITIDIARQKAVMAVALINQMAFKKSRLPFKLEMMDDIGMSPEEKIVADKNMNKLYRYIEDSTLITGAAREAKKGFQQAAIYGVNYYKYNLHHASNVQYERIGDIFEENVINETHIGLERVSVWDIYRDLETDDLQDSRGVIHRKEISNYELRQMLGQPWYDDGAIKQAISDYNLHSSEYSTGFKTRANRYEDIVKKKNTIEYLECWVRAPRAYVEAFSLRQNTDPYEFSSKLEDSGDEVYCLVGLVGNNIIRFTPLNFGQRPFLRQCWEEDVDELESMGVMDTLERYQNSLTGSLREFEDNKKMSANVMLGVKREMVYNKDITPKPGYVFDLSEDCNSVNDAIMPVVTPDVGSGLHDHINLLRDLADDTSNMPREMMGQGGGSSDSVAELNQVIARSSKHLLTVIANFDIVLNQFIEKIYDYVMSNPELSELHGNYKIKAIGFESFEARAIKMASLQQWMNMAAQSEAFTQTMDLEWLIGEMAQGLDFDPDRALKSQEKKALEAQQAQEMQQNDPIYQMELAERQAKIDTEKKKLELDQLRLEIEIEKLALERIKVEKMPNAPISGGVQFLAKGGKVDPTRDTIMGEKTKLEGEDYTDNEVYVDETGMARLITRETRLPKGTGGEVIPIQTRAEGERLVHQINGKNYENLADSFDLG